MYIKLHAVWNCLWATISMFMALASYETSSSVLPAEKSELSHAKSGAVGSQRLTAPLLLQDTPMNRSFMHLHLGFDATGLDDLELHHIVVNSWEGGVDTETGTQFSYISWERDCRISN